MSNEKDTTPSELVEFTFGEDDRKARVQASRFKGEKDCKYRISLAWWKDVDADGAPTFKGKPRFVGQKAHWVDNKGYFLNPNPDSKEGKQICNLLGSTPRFRGATIIVAWPCTRSGKVIGEELREGNFQVLPWVFDPRKYEAFMGLWDEYNFGENDLIITVTNSDFQHMTFLPKQGSLLKQIMDDPKGKKHRARILEEIEERAATIGSEIGQQLTVAQLRRVLAGKPAHDVAAVAEEEIENVDDILENQLDLGDDDDDDDVAISGLDDDDA